MAKYTGKEVDVNAPASQIAEKFEDLSLFGTYLEQIPPEERSKAGDISFERDAIVINNPTVGKMTFNVVERSPEKVVFGADGMLPLTVVVNFKPVGENETKVNTVLEIELPAMLRPLIGGKLQQVADMFGELIGKLVNGSVK